MENKFREEKEDVWMIYQFWGVIGIDFYFFFLDGLLKFDFLLLILFTVDKKMIDRFGYLTAFAVGRKNEIFVAEPM